MRCSSYEDCQVGGGVSARFSFPDVLGVGPAERPRSERSPARSGWSRATARTVFLQRRVHPFAILKASSFFLLLRAGGVAPKVRGVKFADRCRRMVVCQEMSSCTSSYPDRCALAWARTHRPLCLACLTAATGDCAPSNPRVNARFTSCSYEQQSPDRKGSHARFSGDGQSQSEREG